MGHPRMDRVARSVARARIDAFLIGRGEVAMSVGADYPAPTGGNVQIVVPRDTPQVAIDR